MFKQQDISPNIWIGIIVEIITRLTSNLPIKASHVEMYLVWRNSMNCKLKTIDADKAISAINNWDEHLNKKRLLQTRTPT